MGWAAILGLIKRFWYVLPIVGLTIALMLTRGTLADRTVERDTLADWQSGVRDVTSRAANITTKDGKRALLALDQVPIQIAYLGQGLERVSTALAEKNRESEQRAKDLAAAREQDRLNRADADRRFASAQQSIDRLRAIAARPDNGVCQADPDLLRELEGL